ncbi:pyridine nucleotide-disulfide family oxidoreductase [Enterococcus phoeniculicola]|jgi:NADH dehydrogenase|uniref:Pyridine nucleotide-disulfide family oxidoreductase n=1 Tax=Enterococcus phoeniculicola ATCC BAA-412 TaxID=1158610 RepID=R3W459_9ENTE|nr:NAD(P)/FAD-dependent oxidoreductase [Enterococcus phoeniculicola]EOL42412.1 pyridine nucleotide-disulfide family oxidoreductase [Enterococcus phoeniculicola ATCC BAA-412]EOT79309.1 pyridine nucleotide-disulfide family oxidoreductase [Enterococcus phoeniculicola ATCC BAA-412]OJG73152.1 pyridine nucleotide-disulfide family oxidoreductase [Enterococcus phoeniculicola]
MKEVVILGAGYAGLRTLKELQKSKEAFHITLVDQNTYHFEATDLHEVAAGTQPKEKITYNIADVVKPEKTTFIQAKVVKIDREKEEVFLESGQVLTYDYLVVGLGFQSESFGIPGVTEYALEMVDVDSAVKVNEHIHEMMRQYVATKDENFLKIIVCGAGFTGIELLGSLVEGKKALADIAGVTPDKIQIYCVEAVTRLLPMFDEKLADYAVKHLTDWGIQWYTGKPIKEIKPGVVVYQDDAETKETKELEAKTIIWTTGVSGSHVMGDSGFSERRGRVMVSEDLTDPDHKNVYVIGDVSAVMDAESQRPYPTTAQIALKMGTTASKNIIHQLKGEKTEAFTFKSQGSVASIGNTHALGLVGKSSVKGYPASFIKKMIMNKSLLETGGVKEALAKGRFDLYH